MSKLKDYLGVIVTFAAVVGIVCGAMSYFAKASELELVQLRLEQKIVSDQVFDIQKQTWALEERNRQYGGDCSRWPDERDREQYRKLKAQLLELEKRQDRLRK